MKKGILCLAGVLSLLSSANASSLLRSHSATYVMKQSADSNGASSKVEAAQGVLHYRFEETCDGWVVTYDSALQMSGQTGNQFQSVWNYSSWEARDGSALRFESRDRHSNGEDNRIVGEARRKSDGVFVTYKRKSGTDRVLPAQTLFPTMHLQTSLKKAKGKELIFTAPFFDGSEDDAGYDLDTVITRYKGAPLKKAGKHYLDPQVVWTMQMSFYDRDDQKQEPSIEVIARYRDDGIATMLEQKVGSFSWRGSLQDLEYIDDPVCK